jgi:hypothetical protein
MPRQKSEVRSPRSEVVRRWRVPRALVACLIAATALGAKPSDGRQARTLKSYTAVEVLEIDNQRNEKGERLPPELLPAFRTDIETRIAALHQYRRVGTTEDPVVPASGPEAVMQVRVKILGYAGARNGTRVKALITGIDKESGQTVFEKQTTALPDNLLYINWGALSGALRTLAKTTANCLKKQ